MIYDDSMHSESSMPAEPHPAYTPEQLAAIQSLDEPSTTTPKPALSKIIALPTIAAGVLVACAIYKFLNPTLAWIITFFPGIVAVIYVSGRSLSGCPLTNPINRIVGLFLCVMLVASGLWRLIPLIFKH